MSIPIPEAPMGRGKGCHQGSTASRPLHPHQGQQQREAFPASRIAVKDSHHQ